MKYSVRQQNGTVPHAGRMLDDRMTLIDGRGRFQRKQVSKTRDDSFHWVRDFHALFRSVGKQILAFFLH